MEKKQGQVWEKGMHTDFKEEMSYGEYLQLDQILSSQRRLSGHHDEMLFIIIHQASELWMKLMIHELSEAKACISRGELEPSFKMLSRVSKSQLQLIQSWDVLSTLTPSEYMEFRDALGKSSGFQSFQNREIEFLLGKKNERILEIYQHDQPRYKRLEQVLHEPSIYDVSIQALAQRGISVDSAVLNRDWKEPYAAHPSVEEAWLQVYRDVEKYWDLYDLAEKLVDLEDRFQQWRFRHMKTVERVIGMKMGTGGSSGVSYLKQVIDQRMFPELWELRTKL
ncbi:tryptophan 2,3-dioxygenase [Mechercharimyces sp. CAU 1602]|uniref:tryptophan 2,3-dioxygenase n=1 Tax=Mechercharimyces sp. CAU 1602 TaxID=2973933 RepID=UPI0021615F25|nr:tryptophan 2,3-dioxygenase [Mechercharimyces sp. CAU 1602]MCS1351640.1 tryptophan 2,3-dioxygenase [Mechercharimyces sp. CAU 1602]